MPSARYIIALAFTCDFETLDVWTMLSSRTSDCLPYFLPSSIAPLLKDNAAFAKNMSRLQEIMPKFPVTAKEVMEDEQKNVVIVHAISQAHFHEELKDPGIPAEEWKYQSEYMFLLTLDKIGEKIRSVAEFVDSSGTKRLRGLIKRAKANEEKGSTKVD